MKIGIIGAGNMGILYAQSLLHYKIAQADELFLFDKNNTRLHELSHQGFAHVYSVEDVEHISGLDLIILAVKPQDFVALAAQIQSHLRADQLLLSIMAGIPISTIQNRLAHTHVVRAMPNTPALVGQGATVFAAAPEVSIEQIRTIENLLNTTGRTFFVDDENTLDAVTAISGSGPAYFYYIVAEMISAAQKMGMNDTLATLLIKQTMNGAHQLLNNSSKTIPELIASVQSKGGTTEAAMKTFAENEMGEKLQAGLLAAHKRAQELGRENV